MTQLFWEKERQKYDLYISQYVIDECAKGDTKAAQKRLDFIKVITLLQSSDKVDALAMIYQNILDIPEKSTTQEPACAGEAERTGYVVLKRYLYSGFNTFFFFTPNCSRSCSRPILH